MSDRLAVARAFLREADPALAKIIDAYPDFDPRAWLTGLVPVMDAFGTLLFQIIGQQLSVNAAHAITARIQEEFGGRMPEPQQFLDADPERIRKAGLSRRKIETVRNVAQRFVSGELSDAALARMSDAEIETALTAISGIGPWTVRGFLILHLDRADVIPVGDLALRHAIKRLHDLDALPDEKRFLQITDRWRPYRTLAAMYLFESEYERGNARSQHSDR